MKFLARLVRTIWYKLDGIGHDVPHGPFTPTWREAWEEAE